MHHNIAKIQADHSLGLHDDHILEVYVSRIELTIWPTKHYSFFSQPSFIKGLHQTTQQITRRRRNLDCEGGAISPIF